MVFLAIGLRFTKEVQKETIQQNLGTDSRPASTKRVHTNSYRCAILAPLVISIATIIV
jgi:hypothetical protein